MASFAATSNSLKFFGLPAIANAAGPMTLRLLVGEETLKNAGRHLAIARANNLTNSLCAGCHIYFKYRHVSLGHTKKVFASFLSSCSNVQFCGFQQILVPSRNNEVGPKRLVCNNLKKAPTSQACPNIPNKQKTPLMQAAF